MEGYLTYPLAWGGRQRAMETAQHWDRLAKNQPAEIAMFQISEVQESPAFNGQRSFLALRDRDERNDSSASDQPAESDLRS